MTTVREIMTEPVVVVQADDSVAHIAATLDQHRISAVPVVDGDGGVVGLVSEYDLLVKPGGRTAHDVMTTAVITVSRDTDIEDVRHLLIDRRINRVPVVSGGKLVGIVSRADIVAMLITEWVCSACGESMRGEQAPALCPKCLRVSGFVIQEQPPGP